MSTPLRTQLEIRYSNILDFRNIYKPIVSSFAKLSRININNPDTFEENIAMHFIEEGYIIDLKWDRIIFISDTRKENLFEANGPLFYFFRIFDQLKAQAEFGDIKQSVLAEWSLIEMQKTQEEIVEDFKKKYFTPTFLEIESYSHADLAATIEFQGKDDSIRFQFGPFKETNDVKAYKLNPFMSEDSKTKLSRRGLLTQAIVSTNIPSAEIATFKKADKKIADLIKKIEHEYSDKS